MSRGRIDILILNAGELLTLKGPKGPRIGHELRDLGIVRDGAIAVKNGRIAAVGKTVSLSSRFKRSAEVVLDAKGMLVMPGFIDCHTHLIFAGSRENELEMKLRGLSYAEIAKRGGGILRTVRATRKATLDELVDEAKKRLDIMLRFGTTTSEVKSGYGLNLKDEVKMLRAIRRLNEIQPVDLVPTFMGAHALPPEFAHYDEYTEHLTKIVLPHIAENRLAEFCDVFCDKGYFTIEQTRRILRTARALGIKPKLHADELCDVNGAELSAELGAVSAEHLVRSSERGLRKMARKMVVGVLLPASSYAMMSDDYADGRRIIDAGVPAALATDLCPNSWTESMQFVISLACHNMKMLPPEAVSAATINAAHAVSRARDVGSLEEGKLADIIILDVPNHLHIPYHFGISLVERVIKKGSIVI